MVLNGREQLKRRPTVAIIFLLDLEFRSHPLTKLSLARQDSIRLSIQNLYHQPEKEEMCVRTKILPVKTLLLSNFNANTGRQSWLWMSWPSFSIHYLSSFSHAVVCGLQNWCLLSSVWSGPQNSCSSRNGFAASKRTHILDDSKRTFIFVNVHVQRQHIGCQLVFLCSGCLPHAFQEIKTQTGQISNGRHIARKANQWPEPVYDVSTRTQNAVFCFAQNMITATTPPPQECAFFCCFSKNAIMCALLFIV